MTKEEYNKQRPGETIVYEDSRMVIRLKIDDTVHIYIHSKSVDGYEQLPLAYILGSNILLYKYYKGILQ